MPKGYWIVNNLVKDAETYEDYKKANAAVFAKYGARFVVRGGQQQVREGEMFPRIVVLEFPSYQAAIDCYDSAEYAASLKIRRPVAEGTLAIVEGYDVDAS